MEQGLILDIREVIASVIKAPGWSQSDFYKRVGGYAERRLDKKGLIPSDSLLTTFVVDAQYTVAVMSVVSYNKTAPQGMFTVNYKLYVGPREWFYQLLKEYPIDTPVVDVNPVMDFLSRWGAYQYSPEAPAPELIISDVTLRQVEEEVKKLL